MPATDLAHPELNRPLSVEEYRKIQEFPDTWEIEGSILEQYKQIGNAVPHSLGRAIGKLVYKLLNNESIKEYKNFQYSRYSNTTEKDF
jgi:DNA (cytosine-5)-methyltransferase 1